MSNPSCPQCAGDGISLGALGKTRHYRCRQCGWDFHKTSKPKPVTVSTRPSEIVTNNGLEYRLMSPSWLIFRKVGATIWDNVNTTTPAEDFAQMKAEAQAKATVKS